MPGATVTRRMTRDNDLLVPGWHLSLPWVRDPFELNETFTSMQNGPDPDALIILYHHNQKGVFHVR